MRTRRLVVPFAAIAFVLAPAAFASEQVDQFEQEEAPGDVHDASPVPAEPDLTPPDAVEPEPPSAVNRVLLDGEVRQGAFLAGPGSLTFVLHHTLMGAASGFATQGIASGFDVGNLGVRQRMLAGTLVGAGLGFGLSSWWQFNNWIDTPMANFGIVNSVLAGLLFVGMMDLVSDDPLAIAWSGVVGAHAGAWLTNTLAGGKMPMSRGLLISSGGLWGGIYSGLVLAMLGSTGNAIRGERVFDTLAISAGLGGVAAALASARFEPSSRQILRADAFGLGVGAAVWLVSAAVVGFRMDVATPHVLALISSAAAITTVSLLWEEAAERPRASGNPFYRSPELDRPYATVWW